MSASTNKATTSSYWMDIQGQGTETHTHTDMQNKIGGVPIDPKDETLELCDGIVFHFITAQGVLLQRCSIAKDEQSTTSSRQHHLTCSGRSHMICSRIVTIIARNNALMTTVFKTTCSTANIEYGWRWINMDQNRWIWMNMNEQV